MWARLDDELMDHVKIFAAGELIGKNGPAIAIGMYAIGLMWANKHLTDGFLPIAIVRSFPHVSDPPGVADALAKAGLWDKVKGGFHIHGFAEFGNPKAVEVKAKRQKDRERKKIERANGRAHP